MRCFRFASFSACTGSTRAWALVFFIGMVVSRRLLDARVVPWSSWDEWDGVARLSKTPAGIPQAQRYLSMWRLRRSVSIPIAYQALISLRALLLETGNNYEWRLAVSMCVVRLVNGLTDRLQGARARSVKHLAAQLQLPAVLVHIRHQATHGPLPTEKQLREAAVAAVEWIENHYIRPQRNAALSARDIDANEGAGAHVEEIRRVFHGDYTRAKIDATMAETNGDILLKMKECIERAERNNINDDSKPNAHVNGVSGKRIGKATRRSGKTNEKRKWVLCTGDEAKWANMPLGLCPWQTTVGAHRVLPLPAPVPGDPLQRNNKDNADANNAKANKKKNRRILSAEEVMYVKKVRAALLGATP